jgi:hypothetical protein
MGIATSRTVYFESLENSQKQAGAWMPDSKITDLSVTALKWL